MKTFDKYHDEVSVLTEPVNDWMDLNGINILDQMYTNPEVSIFPFQIWVQHTNVLRALENSGPCPRIMERMQGAKVFSRVAKDLGYLDDTQFAILNEMWNFSEREPMLQMIPDLYVYLKVSPTTCLERVRARNRPEERNVDINYLSALHSYHQSWLDQGSITNFRGEQTEVIVVDADVDIKTCPTLYDDVAEKIMAKIRWNASGNERDRGI